MCYYNTILPFLCVRNVSIILFNVYWYKCYVLLSCNDIFILNCSFQHVWYESFKDARPMFQTATLSFHKAQVGIQTILWLRPILSHVDMLAIADVLHWIYMYGFRMDRRGRRREGGSWQVPGEGSPAPVTGRLDTSMVGVHRSTHPVVLRTIFFVNIYTQR